MLEIRSNENQRAAVIALPGPVGNAVDEER